MGYCSEKGMPHSQFLEWEDEDRAKELAYLMEEGERCQLCGTAPWEWEENRFAYTAMEKTCNGCRLKSLASDSEHAQPGTTIELVPSSKELTAQMKLREMKRQRDRARERAEREEG